MKDIIVFIGPMCAGKSTIAELLAERMQRPRYELDELRWDYYREFGYNKMLAAKIAEEDGMLALLEYWKPFEADAVERAIADHDNCVLDFGAGHSVYNDDIQFRQVQAALAPLQHVILLLPSSNPKESTTILNARLAKLLEREMGQVNPELLQANEHFITHPSNQALATATVYTNDKSPEETCAEIYQLILTQEEA